MPVTAGARGPVSMRTVGTSEKIGAQCRCATGGKVPKHPQFVVAQLEQMQQSGEGSTQDGTQREAVVGGIRAALHQRTERVHISPLGDGLARVTGSPRA